MIEYPFKQHTAEWKESRLGVCTASRARDVRRTDGLTKQQRMFVDAIRAGKGDAQALIASGYKKRPTSDLVDKAIAGALPLQFGDTACTYARELARERLGGKEPEGFQGFSQRIGHEEEPFAAIEYVAKTGRSIDEAFFITTDDRKFGMSLDRWVDRPAGVTFGKHAIEIKTMVSSSTLFNAMVDGDISEYRDQCLFGLWLLSLEWIDLCLWCADLQALHIVRIERDEDELQALEDDLLAFDGLVCEYESALRKAIGRDVAKAAVPVGPKSPPPRLPAAATQRDLVADPFA